VLFLAGSFVNAIVVAVLVLLAFLVVLRISKRGRRRRTLPTTGVYSRRIEGFQVTAFLRPEISGACLFDHGVQFGRGFRRKESPSLPHDEHCSCVTAPFSFTSNEVFNGALRQGSGIPTTVPTLEGEAARQLIESLRTVNQASLPETPKAYLALVGLEDFPAASREGIEEFLRARYDFLRAGEAENRPKLTDGGPHPHGKTAEQA